MANKIILGIKKLNAKLHLKYKCPNCPKETWMKRDVDGSGKCFWKNNWENGIYDLETYASYRIKKMFK